MGLSLGRESALANVNFRVADAFDFVSLLIGFGWEEANYMRR